MDQSLKKELNERKKTKLNDVSGTEVLHGIKISKEKNTSCQIRNQKVNTMFDLKQKFQNVSAFDLERLRSVTI